MTRKYTRNNYTPEKKSQIVLEVFREEQTFAQLATAHSIHVNLLRKWKAQVVERLPSLFDDQNKTVRDLEAEHERERQELYAEIGRLTTQLAWLKKKSGLNPDAK
jgi:transposase-like protein